MATLTSSLSMLNVASLIQIASKYYPYKAWDFSRIREFGDREWQQLPFLTSEQLKVLNNELDHIPCPQGEVLFFSSGTTGNPKVIRYSQSDLDRVASLCTRFAKLEGVSKESRVMVLLPMALWSVGKITVMMHMQAGATVFPVDLHGGVDIWQQMADVIKPTIISSTPSVLYEWAPLYKGPKLELIETTGEPLLARERHLIEAKFGSFVYDTYGLSECVVGVNCGIRQEFHFWPDAVGIEVVEPGGDKTLTDEQSGEVVVTSFMQERMPIIRYRTGDRGRLIRSICECGETDTPRIVFEGRVAETYQLPRGVTLDPTDIHESLEEAGVQGQVIWKGKPGSPAAPYVERSFIPTLEILLRCSKYLNIENLRKSFLTSLPELSELVHENEIIINFVNDTVFGE